MQGEIVNIWIKRFKRGPMDAVAEARLVTGRGIAGNADQGGRRQVTLIDEAAWQAACADLGIDVDPSLRRANVMLRGVDLARSRGKFLRIGGCLIRIFGETRPCSIMDDQLPGLLDALDPDWRAGAFGEILEGGVIRIGDAVEWEEEQVLQTALQF